MGNGRHTFFRKPPVRILGLALLFGALGYLSYLQVRTARSPYSMQPKKRLFQIQPKKQKSLSEIRKANLLPVLSPVVINGIGIAGPNGPFDETGSPADWIDLYNKSSRPVSLRNCSLTDSTARTRKWVFPAITMQPESHLLIWLDGKSDIIGSHPFEAMEANDWMVNKDGFNTASGYAWYNSNTVAHADLEPEEVGLESMIRVHRPGDYSVWLRTQALGERPSVLECRMDDGKPTTVDLKPSKQYQIHQLQPPRHGPFWKLDKGEHRLRIRLVEGEVNIEKAVLTPADAAFGLTDPALHADIRLRKDGEMVALYSPQGVALDYVVFPALADGQSFGRNPPGAERLEIMDPAPLGLPLTKPPILSLDSGFVEKRAEVSARAVDPADTVRYTLDGSIPSESSPVFPPSLSVTSNTVLRARAFRAGAMPGAAATRVFWAGERPPTPVLWIVMDPPNLFGGEHGIMVNFLARGVQSERPGYVCLLYPDGTVQTAHAGVRNQGRGSRVRSLTRSFRITCRSRYGTEFWPGKIFEQEGPDRAHCFLVHANNLVVHPLGMEIMDAVGSPGPRTRHCLMLMNNDPYGLYFILEDVEQPTYLQEVYGHLDLDIIKHKTFSNPLIMGTWDEYNKSWAAMHKLRQDQITPDMVSQITDLRLFTRWIATCQFLGYGDNNQSYFICNRRAPPPRWTFINNDLDGAFYYFIIGDTNRLCGSIEGIRGQVFSELKERPEYRRYYINEFQQLLNHVFRPEHWMDRLHFFERELLPYGEFQYQGVQNQKPRNAEKYTRKVVQQELESEFISVRQFFKVRDRMARTLLAQTFKTGEPLPVKISFGEVKELRIDGWTETNRYEGLYFPGTTLSIQPVSPEQPLRFNVNGDEFAADVLATNVTEALEIRVGRDD